MPVRLHRCWVPARIFHACWRAEKALRDMGIEYKRVLGTPNRWNRDARKELIAETGQNVYPTIVFEDGSFYREESRAMAETIRAGKLDEKRGAQRAPNRR